ncbi:hypothetical protein J2S16_003075 [Cytobacillus kochii]|nr:hypothetical protein [Cytobacillus kochii]
MSVFEALVFACTFTSLIMAVLQFKNDDKK